MASLAPIVSVGSGLLFCGDSDIGSRTIEPPSPGTGAVESDQSREVAGTCSLTAGSTHCIASNGKLGT